MTTIRKATPSDIPLIREMARKTFPATYSEILSREQTDYMMEWMYSPESLRDQMERQGHVYYIACEDNEPGRLCLRPATGIPGCSICKKSTCCPPFRNAGWGASCSSTRSPLSGNSLGGPCTMELNVNRDNPALGFYEHMGMKKVRQGDFPIGNGYYMNDYIMALRIE